MGRAGGARAIGCELMGCASCRRLTSTTIRSVCRRLTFWRHVTLVTDGKPSTVDAGIADLGLWRRLPTADPMDIYDTFAPRLQPSTKTPSSPSDASSQRPDWI